MQIHFSYILLYILIITMYKISAQAIINSTAEYSYVETNNTNNSLYLADDFACDEDDLFEYENDEYKLFPNNNSVYVYGEIIPPGKYLLVEEDILLVCRENDSQHVNETEIISTEVKHSRKKSPTLHHLQIYGGRIASFVSIIALIIHLITFCYVPSLRNLPGYNLVSLSVAFIFAYTFLLIAQIPEIVGLSCLVTGVFKYFFFFAAFFFMNVMAFDVWRTLKFTIKNLIVFENDMHLFIRYSVYAWGCPLLVTMTLVILDITEDVPDYIKPKFGENDVCSMTNNRAKNIFFVFPVLLLFTVNAIFFIKSAFIISNNIMKCRCDHRGKTARVSFFLYLRLGLMMGVTWLLGVLGVITDNDIIWFIYDILNSLQGLFLFLLFTCSRKVIKYLNENISLKDVRKSKRLSTTSRTESI